LDPSHRRVVFGLGSLVQFGAVWFGGWWLALAVVVVIYQTITAI
jgi:hypothetical protein